MVSPVRGDYRRCQAEIPLIVLCRFPGPALTFSAAALSLVRAAAESNGQNLPISQSHGEE